MKGNETVIATLNALLADELTAISQYMVHSEMCDNWGYVRLHKVSESRAVDEMKHADNGTRDLLTAILKEEEVHIDWLEAQKDQIAQMGIQIYLSIQVKE